MSNTRFFVGEKWTYQVVQRFPKGWCETDIPDHLIQEKIKTYPGCEQSIIREKQK
jgi:hypothetical protein